MKLDSSDRMLRYGNPVGMENGIKEIILRHCGFELYNTRPYHNYETWSDGYIIIWRFDGKTISFEDIPEAIKTYGLSESPYSWVSKEDLDEAVEAYLKKRGTLSKYQQAEVNLSKNSRRYQKTESKTKGLFGAKHG